MLYLPFDGKNSPGIPFTLNRASPQARGLLLWYPTAAYNGASLRDYSASAHRFGGTITGPPGRRLQAQIGAGLDFTGSERWEVTHTADLSSTVRTLSAWVSVDFGGSTHTIWKKDAEFILRLEGGAVKAYTWTDGSARSATGPTLSDNTLYHLAATWDGTTQRVYVNGFEYTTSTPGGTTNTSSNNIAIGAQSGGGEGFDGIILDPRYYNVVLTAAEILQTYLPQTRWDLYQPLLPTAYKAPTVASVPKFYYHLQQQGIA